MGYWNRSDTFYRYVGDTLICSHFHLGECDLCPVIITNPVPGSPAWRPSPSWCQKCKMRVVPISLEEAIKTKIVDTEKGMPVTKPCCGPPL